MSLGRFVALGSPDHRALMLNNAAVDLCRKGEFEDAEKLFIQALKIWETAPDIPLSAIATCCLCLGSVSAALGDFDGAIAHLDRALRLARTIPGWNPEELRLYESILAGIQTGDPIKLRGAKDGARRMWTGKR